ncbi:MAG: ISAzo13 family transposase [Nitrososphaera sp.]
MIRALERLMQHDTAGDPCSGLKWTRKTTGKIRDELAKAGIPVSRSTVGRLLKHLGYSLRVNHKKIARGSPETRDRQFRYIAQLKEAYQGEDLPVVSVDTKKKELVGRFKNPGRVWTQTPLLVNDHDFRSDAKGRAVPYGVFDLGANRGRVVVGTSHDTPAFAVDALVDWWIREGRRRYPAADHLLVLADNGGSNGSRVRAWKYALQTKLCDRFGFAVTVCHYPPGASKWNPIEHRMFSEISKNWAGRPLESFETILKYIRTTQTVTGLRVGATFNPRDYPTGVQIDDHALARINLARHDVLPDWNYTLGPTSQKLRSYS